MLCEGCGTLYLIIWFKEGVFITCGMLGILSSNLSVMRRQHTNTWMKSFVVWPDIHFSKCDFFSMTVSAGISEWGRGCHRIMFKGVLKKGGGRTSRRDAGKQTFIKLQIYACGPQTLLESCDWLIDWLIFFLCVLTGHWCLFILPIASIASERLLLFVSFWTQM